MNDRAVQISRAALAVFARYGLKRASMADVAEEAGLSRPAIYQYFRSKQDLVAACFDLVTEDGFALAEQAAAAQSGRERRVAAYLSAHMCFFHRLIYAGPHSDEVLELKTQFGADKVAAARARLVARLNALAGREAGDDLGFILAHGAEGIKTLTPDEAVLARRLVRLVHALMAEDHTAPH